MFKPDEYTQRDQEYLPAEHPVRQISHTGLDQGGDAYQEDKGTGPNMTMPAPLFTGLLPAHPALFSPATKISPTHILVFPKTKPGVVIRQPLMGWNRVFLGE